MGKPTWSYVQVSYTEYIGIWGERRELKHLSTCRRRNQIRDSVSSGERTRSSPNQSVYILGLWGPNVGLTRDSRMAWKGQPKTVTVRYAKFRITLGCPRVPRDTWNLVGIWEDHLPRLNTHRWPIVNQYREGKVKRTGGPEWNRTWNRLLTICGSTMYLYSVTACLLHNESTSYRI